MRLPDGADHVLACFRIDAGLAADRGIGHGQQRCRDLYIGDAAHVHRRGETCDVPAHAAAQSDDEILSGEMVFSHEPAEIRDGVQGLALFPRREGVVSHLVAGIHQTLRQRFVAFAVEHVDGLVTHDAALAPRAGRQYLRDAACCGREKTILHEDVIGS